MSWTWLIACAVATIAPPEPAPPAPPAPPVPEVAIVAPAAVWPAAGAPLTVVKSVFPADWTPPRLVLDPGHGAPGNPGNTSIRCESEQDFTKRTVDALLPRFDARVQVRTPRPDAALVAYKERIRLAEDWPADAIISLHSDARAGDLLGADPITGCLANVNATGFSVLWSDEGDPAAVAARQRLAHAVAARMIEAGFPAYGGADYAADLYAGDEAHPGVFVDRHAPKKRIMMLRRPKVPTILVETHQAFDRDEVARWDEPATLDAFASALQAAMIDFARQGSSTTESRRSTEPHGGGGEMGSSPRNPGHEEEEGGADRRSP